MANDVNLSEELKKAKEQISQWPEWKKHALRNSRIETVTEARTSSTDTPCSNCSSRD